MKPPYYQGLTRFFMAVVIFYICVILILHAGPAYHWWGNPRPFCEDFVSFWASSSLAINEGPESIYNTEKLHAMEQSVFPSCGFSPWHYPPTFLLLVYPLSCLPFSVSLVFFLGLSLCAYAFMTYKFYPHSEVVWLSLAYPGTFFNFTHGQNGYITTALLGGGLYFMDRRPILSGILLGCITYKPHLAVIIPFALLTGRYWKVLFSFCGAALFLISISLIAFGYKPWVSFFSNISYTLTTLEHKLMQMTKMPTAFAMVRIVSDNNHLANIVHSTIALAAFLIVLWIWYKRSSLVLRSSSICLGMLLLSPFSWIYDLTILLLPIVLYGWVNRTALTKTGLLILVIGWSLPITSTLLAEAYHFQFAPLYLLCFLGLILWHATTQAEQQNEIETSQGSKEIA